MAQDLTKYAKNFYYFGRETRRKFPATRSIDIAVSGDGAKKEAIAANSTIATAAAGTEKKDQIDTQAKPFLVNPGVKYDYRKSSATPEVPDSFHQIRYKQ